MNLPQIRKLSETDLDQIVKINLQHSKVMGLLKNSNYDQNFFDNILLFFNSSQRYILGAFEEEKLVSFICVIHWNTLPYWTFVNAKAIPFLRGNTFQPSMNGIAPLISKVLTDELQNNRFIYWFLTSQKRIKGHRNYWSRFVPELEKFYFISRVIKKDYRPRSDFVWDLMGKQVWSKDLVIRIGVEKSHFELLAPYEELFAIINKPNANLSELNDTEAILEC